MNMPEPPKFQWGQRVSAAADLFNDGSFPDRPADALLVKAGDSGEIVQVGTHVETGTHIYLVEFKERLVVGCLEGELRSSIARLKKPIPFNSPVGIEERTMKVMIRKTPEGKMSAYVPKKDLEEHIVSMEKPEMWGGVVTLANGWQLELPDLAADTKLPITVEARKLGG